MIFDLFGGPGGWDEAAAELGIPTVGIEWDASACATRAAAGHATIRADVARYPVPSWSATKIEGLVASPPCQAFSNAGQRLGMTDLEHLFAHVHACTTGWVDTTPREWADPRSELVLEPLRWADGLHPRWVALEQVPPVLPLWEAMAVVLRGWGYSCWTGILNAAGFGVPQTRRRAILMASRDRPALPPEPTHCRGGADGLFGTLKPWVSMADALGWNGDEQVNTRGDRKTPGGNNFDTDGPSWAVTGKGRSWWVLNTGRDWKPGGTRDDAQQIPVTEPPPALDGAHSGAGRWWFTRPATTVAGDPRVGRPGHKEREHGEQSFERDAIRVTVAEGLALQGFPSDYPVRGSKTKQWEQVGNALVPTSGPSHP